MKIRLIKILFTLIVLLSISFPGNCTELPQSLVSFIREKFPEAGIRFDGMIELTDATKYLLVLPLVRDKEKKPLEVIQTIPAGADFAEKPDMVLFNNNFALLKIIEKKGESPTVISSDEMPLKVKLGLLPQDLVVPKGLKLPQELKVILGDLKIPLKPRTDKEGEVAFYGRTEISENNEGKIIGETAENVTKLPELDFLKGKNLYTLNYKYNKLNVIDSQTGRIETEINLPSMAIDMTLTADERYLLLPGNATGSIFVVDTLNNEFVKVIPVGKYPSSVIAPPGMNRAFVANRFSSGISEIDLINMQVEKMIPVNGYPECIQIAENDKFLFYSDSRTGKIYQLNLQTGYSWELFEVKNVSKIEQFGKYLFALSRSEDTITVFDLKKSEIIKRTKTGKKPLDMKVIYSMGRILVVCAESDELNIIDMENFDLIKKIPLKSGGFPGKIWLVENKALITNYDSYEIIIYNVDAEKIHGHIPVNRIFNSVVTSDK